MIYDKAFMFQNEATVVGNGNILNCNRNDTITIEIYGTGVAVIVFECLMPSGRWYSMSGIRLPITTYTVATQTSSLDERWQFSGIDCVAMRMRIDSIDLGSCININSKVVVSFGK